MDVRSEAAELAGRATQGVLHTLLHRDAAQVPGRVALAVDEQFVAHARGKLAHGSIVICGTNGKTTTTNVVAAALEEAGQRVLCNRTGANMLPGVASALLPAHRADWAVLEADELSTIHILPQLRPDYLVLLNLFRDQLDRAGEIDHVADTLVAALAASPETALLVCADDPLSMGVARRAAEGGTRVLGFGIAEDLGLSPDRVPEARFCQRCGALLDYAYHTYAQLGAFSCPSCDFARPTLDFRATEVAVDREGVAFTFGQADGTSDGTASSAAEPTRVQADFGGIYMVYNLLAACAATTLAGVDVAAFQRALDGYHPANGRLQHFRVDGREVVLNLAKNPTGFNQNIALLLADDRRKAVYVVVNDEANDGHDVSWIWDMDVERLADRDDVALVLAGGHRANDVQVRMKYAGIRADLASDVAQALARVDDLPADVPLYVLTNYSALRPARDELERMEAHHG